jgi:hypothetical protein
VRDQIRNQCYSGAGFKKNERMKEIPKACGLDCCCFFDDGFFAC